MRLKKVLCLSLSLAMVLGSMNVSTTEAKSKVSLSHKKLTIKVGKTKKVTLKGAKKKVKWSVKGKKIVSIKATGKKKQVCRIKAKRAGKCVVKAKYKGVSYKCSITVTKNNKGVSVTPVPNGEVGQETVTPSTKVPAVSNKPSAEPVNTPYNDTKPLETPKVSIKPIKSPEVSTEPAESPKISFTPSKTPGVSSQPSGTPSISFTPSSKPNVSANPTAKPTGTPVVTSKPTAKPTGTPVVTSKPTAKPTAKPSSTPVATVKPTAKPTGTPTAAPHVHTEIKVSTKDTCMKCSTCGAVTKQHYIIDDIVREPNCSSKVSGLRKCTCKYCDYSSTRSIPWEHKFDSNHICRVCGEVDTDSKNYAGYDNVGEKSSGIRLYYYRNFIDKDTMGYDVVLKTLKDDYIDEDCQVDSFILEGNIKKADIYKVIFANKVNIKNCKYLFMNLGENLHKKSSDYIVSSIVNLENLDTTGATNMRGMFCNAYLEGDLVCNFNTENVTDMSTMFSELSDVRSITLKFNNTDKLISTRGMFSESKKVQYIENKGVFNTKNVTDMSSMFKYVGASAFTYHGTTGYTNEGIDNMLDFIESLNTNKVEYFNNMFQGTMQDLSNKEITLDLTGYDTFAAESMDSMFDHFNYKNSAKCVVKLRIASTTVDSRFRYMFGDFAVNSFKSNKDSVIDLGSSFFDMHGGIVGNVYMFAGSNALRLTADNNTSKENIRKIVEHDNMSNYVTVS